MNEHGYLDLMERVLRYGKRRKNRTGIDTLGVFGAQLLFQLKKGFPAVTTKKLNWASVVAELLWFIRGETNVAGLNREGVGIWDPWAREDGDLGPIYGKQWRSWPLPGGGAVDQLAGVIETIKSDPGSRRMVVSAWNVADIPDMALPPCHLMFQFYVSDGDLSCHMYMRSADLFLGVPFNIASYALLTHMVAKICGLSVGDLIISFGDAHVYENHIGAVRTQLDRAPRPAPTLILAPGREVTDIGDFSREDCRLANYNPHPAIKADIAV